MQHFDEVLALARTAKGKDAARRIQMLATSLEKEGGRECEDQAKILRNLLWRIKVGETLLGIVESAKSPDDKDLATKIYRTYQEAGGH